MPPRRRTSTGPGLRRPRVAGLPGQRDTDRPDEHRPDTGTLVDTAPRPPATGLPAPGAAAPDARVPGDPESARPAPAGSAPADAVAGEALRPDGPPADGPTSDGPTSDGPTSDGPTSDGAAADGVAADATAARRPRGRNPLRSAPVLAALLAVLVAASAFFAIGTAVLRSSPAAANTALTDVATTAEVAAQLGDALELVYSYDFARLDENERAAREVISPAFAAEFDPLYAQVRELAPQVQAVVSAVVTASAVQSIEGDRAVLVAFMDQQATTVADGQQAASQGRLLVSGVRIDGRWKIDSVESR